MGNGFREDKLPSRPSTTPAPRCRVLIPPYPPRSLPVVPPLANGGTTARLRGGSQGISRNMRARMARAVGGAAWLFGEPGWAWRVAENRKTGKRRGSGRGPAPASSGRDPFHRVPHCSAPGRACWETAASVAMRLGQGRGRGPLSARPSSRQYAGRCESRWPFRLWARRSAQRKAR
jgi:hypothetical protein